MALATPILNHRDKDIKDSRKLLRNIIDGKIEESAQAIKNKIEAAKLLLRAHHALQIDKQVIKDSQKPTTEKPALRAEHQKTLDKILNEK